MSISIGVSMSIYLLALRVVTFYCEAAERTQNFICNYLQEMVFQRFSFPI